MLDHEPIDAIIRRASIVDGTGARSFVGDVALRADRVVAIGDLDGLSSPVVIDAEGLVLAPGFIDVHSHDDQALLSDPGMPAKVTQGVTTVIGGNCGVSLAPLVTDAPPPPLDVLTLGHPGVFRFPSFGAYLSALDSYAPAVNSALMVGHSTLRVATMADVTRAASPSEIEAMRRLLREALQSGAIGFSTGLFYPTNRAAPMEEVVVLLEELAGTGAIYATHMRDEADGVVASLEESFETAKRAGVPLVISHHKCMGKRNFGRSVQTLAMIDEARRDQSVGLDAYPYEAGSSVLLPELLEKSSRTRLSWSTPHPELAGRDLADIAAAWGVAQAEALERLRPGGGIYYMMDQADVDRILAYPHTMIGSDGLPHDPFPHPRLWGTFPRVLGHFARERGLFSLEDAVRRMTGLPAQQFGLRERGIVKPGAFADLVLFDPQTVTDRATFDEPTRPADGIKMVMVNGVVVLDADGLTGARPGRVLRRAQRAD